MLFKSRRARRALLATALVAGAVGVVPAAAQASGGHGNAALPKVMTRNLYLGADLNPAIAAIQQCQTLPPQQCQGLLLATNQGIWNQVVQTNFPERAKRLAKEIDDHDPYIVGLQEVALWRSGPVDGQANNATTVEYDFLASLMSELAARGTKYQAAVVQQEADLESPSGTPPTFADARDRRLTMRDVILVRKDLPKFLVSFSNPQSGNYDISRTIVLPTGSSYGDIVFTRGWTSIDIKLLGKPVARFVNTHLESAASGIRQLQAAELVGAFGSGPLLTSMPAILVGDLNSDPDIPYGGNPASSQSDGAAYGIIAGTGFVDSGNTSKTFGHDSDLLDPPSDDAAQFTERIDHILTRPGAFGLLSTWIVGRDPANRTPGGLWPTDHAGVIAGIG